MFLMLPYRPMKMPRFWDAFALRFMRLFLASLRCAAGLAFFAAWSAHAQFRVDVSGVGLTQVPIAFSPFRGEDNAPQRIASIVQADLERSGLFRALAAGQALDETSRPDMSVMRQRGADALHDTASHLFVDHVVIVEQPRARQFPALVPITAAHASVAENQWLHSNLASSTNLSP